jgi:hypothetical protein
MSIDETPSEKTTEDEAANAPTILSPPPVDALASTTESDLAIVVADSGASIPTPPKGPKFAELGLRPEVLRALEDMGFEAAMEVQAATLPLGPRSQRPDGPIPHRFRQDRRVRYSLRQ